VLRLELDTRSVADWNEIDFVGLIGTRTLQEGILPANVSGVFYVPNAGFVGDDSLSFLPCVPLLCCCTRTCRSFLQSITSEHVGVGGFFRACLILASVRCALQMIVPLMQLDLAKRWRSRF
jgi:hypothetical protein